MSYEKLVSITKEAREIAEQERQRPLVACPVCGALLQSNAKGVLNCPMGHFRTNEVGGGASTR